MKGIKIESKYDVKRVIVDCSCDTPITKQSFKDQCDANKIMSKYDKTGLFTHVNPTKGWYGEVPEGIDFHTAQNLVIQGEAAFMRLPAEIRTQFDNDPGKFLEFVGNPDNKDKMKEMGLIKPDAAVLKKASELEKGATGGDEKVAPDTK